MKSAKELCSLLITRKLQELGDEEEDVIVDYLEELGIEVDLDMDVKTMCVTLLDKAMEDEIGRRVPITAYANQILAKEAELKRRNEEKREIKRKKREIERKRETAKNKFASLYSDLPGCVGDDSIMKRELYNLRIDPDFGVKSLTDGDMLYSASVGVSPNVYKNIYLNVSNPILELTSVSGNRIYVRVTEPLNIPDNTLVINPLVQQYLDSPSLQAFAKLCVVMPEIEHIDFTYYGDQTDLDRNLKLMVDKLPQVVNALSSLRLGMELVVNTSEGLKTIRVDGLKGKNDTPLFAGVLPFGEQDLPFSIEVEQ